MGVVGYTLIILDRHDTIHNVIVKVRIWLFEIAANDMAPSGFGISLSIFLCKAGYS